MKVTIGKYPKNNKPRVEKIQIDPWDSWSLDYTLALIILPALQSYKERASKEVIWSVFYPYNFDSLSKRQQTQAVKRAEKQQAQVLDKMIRAFELIVEDCTNIDDTQIIQDGLNLFAKYYRALWI